MELTKTYEKNEGTKPNKPRNTKHFVQNLLRLQ